MRTFTWLFTFIGAALCVVHYMFHDHDSIYLIFYALSVPAWFAPVVSNIYEISPLKMLFIYALTIITWGIVGYVIDRFSAGYRRKSKY
ncbi:hypothetical protein [Paenibacillus hexagrammi]|uniref:Uncharacterized protein n=1 Tax=Paenibacillus hexagrammi TaxID=2908839 RepID=A0ABY3SIK6_9BACL|nr:hypothetical protein [Paenibacillus sp. YPD9-1]UJF33328.1 hypothetical protein L0M14_28070 [Paenibacillus sp. YPD9-1]